MHELVHCYDEAVNHQLPIAATFWIIQIVSIEECSSLMQNLMQICCSTCSVILNAIATQYTCSLNGIYRPHWLVQWSYHYSHMSIPVHSPWLPAYLDFTQTVLIILTMAGLFFPDRLCISEIIWYLSFSVWLISLSIILPRSIHAIANGKILFFFNGQIISHCIYVPQLFFPGS